MNISLGTGIAIAGVWVFAGLLSLSERTTGVGVVIGIGVAAAMTWKLLP